MGKYDEFQNPNLTFFNNVYEFGKEFDSEADAVKFANGHDWTKEVISDTEYASENFYTVDTTTDNKVEIIYDEDWDAFFFRYIGND